MGMYKPYVIIHLVFSFLATCVPYSEDACRTSAETLGLKFKDAGSFAVKGCYAYKDGKYAKKVYYGRGGTKEQMMASPEAPKYRPNGYDCSKFLVPNIKRIIHA
jgi:hypothetical protein